MKKKLNKTWSSQDFLKNSEFNFLFLDSEKMLQTTLFPALSFSQLFLSFFYKG